MKKFLIISTILFMIVLNALYSNNINKIIPISESYFAKADESNIYIIKDNEWSEFEIVGVNLNSAKPGSFPSENVVDEDDYLRWINYIYEMGANCLKVSNNMNESFYEALYEFNEDKKDPMYLMQGIYFDEEYLKDGYDPQDEKVEDVFKRNIELVVDAVHGHAYDTEDLDSLLPYKKDVSDYVIGYTLGIEFAKNDIIYTEIMNEENSYNGEYLYTKENASSLESYMARMGDYLAKYEEDNYNKQSLISFIGSSSYDVVSLIDEQKTNNSDGRESKSFLDPENIKSKNKLKTGIIASYNIYPSYSQLKEYEGDMGYYFEALNEYHSIPVIIGELAIPSSRVITDHVIAQEQDYYIDENQQGIELVKLMKSIDEANLSGSFIYQFKDGWHSSSSNTKELKILDRSPFWSDAQTTSQNFGLMAFDPGQNKSVSYVDDNIDEWNDKTLISQNDDMKLYVNSDEKYLYIMVKTDENLDVDKDNIYIDLDITKNSGSNKSSQYNLEFDADVDFIVNIDDYNYSNIMAHEYYNTSKFLNSKKDNKALPNTIDETKNMDMFSPIFIDIRPKMYVNDEIGFMEKLEYETGKLVHGNANPESENYNSTADFYIGKDYIEIKIPWALLNFMDPSTNQIQNDFYESFKISPTMIQDIGIGVTLQKNDKNKSRLNQVRYDLKSWINPTYHERLKKSYYIVQDYLKN